MSELAEQIAALGWELVEARRRIAILKAKQQNLPRFVERSETVTSSPVTLTDGTKWSNEAGGFVA